MAAEIATTGDERQWIAKRSRQRHDCQDHLPDVVPVNVQKEDIWRCPQCHRRWRLVDKATGDRMFSPEFAEGVVIDGPDGSTYWRPFRARLIGRLGA
jgi:hypothetical protein